MLNISKLELILFSGLLMSTVAGIGAFTFFLNEESLKKLLHFFISLAAGSLLGGALFHLLPEALRVNVDMLDVFSQ